MSNEFFEQQGAGGNGSGSTGGPGGSPDMDALFEVAVNQEDVRGIQSDSLKPVGSYVTVPVLNLQAARATEGFHQGRLMFRFFGPAEMTVTEKNTVALKQPVGTVIRGQFGFGISPERRNKLVNGVDQGSPDGASQRWAQAVKAYETAYKSKPATVGDVVRFIQNYAVVVRVIQVGVPSQRFPEPDGEPGNVVMAISAMRESVV